MAPRGGLGPLGHAAIQRAFEYDQQRHGAAHVTPPSQLGNPAVTSTELADEAETIPADERWVAFPESSRVVEAGYDPPSQRLYVRFVKPVPEGTPWVYEGVPANVWTNFRRSQSQGRFVNRVLNQYNYHRSDF